MCTPPNGGLVRGQAQHLVEETMQRNKVKIKQINLYSTLYTRPLSLKCSSYLSLIIHRRVLQCSQDSLVGWGWGGIWAVDSQENH